jgi:O-antigen/teichoic acid export membrane protein
MVSKIKQMMNIDFLLSPLVRKNIVTSVYYFGGSFVGMLIAIFTQPVFSRHLEPWDFAVMGYFATIQGFFMPLFSLNFTTYYLTSYWDNSDNRGKDLSFNLNTLNIANIVVAMLALVLIIIYFRVVHVTFPLYPFTILILLNLFIEKYKAYYLLNCRLKKMGPSYFIFTVFHVILNTGLGLLFVVKFAWGAEGRMLGQTLAMLLLVLFVVVNFIRNRSFSPSLKIDVIAIKRVLKFCWPLIVGSYLYFPVSNLDKLLLERVGNIEEFGYYNLGSSMAGYFSTFFITFYMAFEPDFYKFTSQRKIKEFSYLALFYIGIIVFVTTFSILLSEPIIGYLTSNRYPEAAKYFNLILISMCLYNIGDMFQQIFNSLNKTRLVMLRNAMMGILSISLYIFLIHKWEFLGAAWAKVIIFSFYVIVGLALFFWRYNNKVAAIIRNR